MLSVSMSGITTPCKLSQVNIAVDVTQPEPNVVGNNELDTNSLFVPFLRGFMFRDVIGEFLGYL